MPGISDGVAFDVATLCGSMEICNAVEFALVQTPNRSSFTTQANRCYTYLQGCDHTILHGSVGRYTSV